MLFNRRAVLAGALALLPAAKANDDELLALGARLEVLRRRVMGKRRAMTEGAGWAKWNEAVVAAGRRRHSEGDKIEGEEVRGNERQTK